MIGIAVKTLIMILFFIYITETKNCKTCDRILSALETRNVELEEAGIKLVKLNDKKAAKKRNVELKCWYKICLVGYFMILPKDTRTFEHNRKGNRTCT